MPKNTALLLSICIPAYNGSKYITETLTSILNQNQRGVEVVVVDDRSTDNTFDVVIEFAKKNPDFPIRVIKNKKNLGFDGNVLNMVSKAQGEFCWLLGQDDKLLPGATRTVLAQIKKHPNASLIYCNYTRYDDILKKITSGAMINIKKDKVFRDFNQFFFYRVHQSYFQYLGTNVITMSTDVVNRKLWKKVESVGRKGIGHNFIHCFMIAKMIRDNSYIAYLGEPQVWYRSNNHRVWPNDIWKDYNKVFIDFLIEQGFDTKRAIGMRKNQAKYEKRETATKHPFLKYFYKYAKPVIGFARMVKSNYF